MDKPDSTDWKIITLLNEDGRMPSAEIARRLGNISARTVTNRIESLIKKGIINIRAIVNPDMVGYKVMADVFIEVEPRQVREVARQVAEFPQVSYVACATGDKDIIISARARNIEELYHFTTEVIGRVPGVQRTQTYFMPLNVKDHFTWLPPDINENDLSANSEESDKTT